MSILVGIVFAEAHQAPPEGKVLQLELKVWEYALQDIPTSHLAECVKRALRAKRDDYMLKTSQVLREWDGLKEELRHEAHAHANEQAALLQAGHGSMGLMTLTEFKARHNLPAGWQLGQPYPPESDLYGKPVPEKREAPVRCLVCRDAHFTVDRSVRNAPRLVPCPRCQPRVEARG